MKKPTFRQVIRAIHNYVIFFLTVSFVVSCCMMLFLSTLAETMDLTFHSENITAAAKLTFGNVVLITLLFCIVDYLRRRITVDRPVQKVIQAAEKITQGDFSVRIAPMHGMGTEGFNQIIQAINQMAEELSGTETLRTDFIANVSHELKTPLAVLQNYGTLLQQPDLPRQQRLEYARAISQTSQDLAAMITNILKLNKLENQQIFPKTQQYDLSEQLRQCLLQFENVWEQKNIDIDTHIEDAVMVNSDEELLSLVWNNLFSNAFKFTESGGTVRVSLTTENNEAVVTVSDTGCGMTAEVGAHIFEKFYQGDTSHATAGNGLGLPLVKRVMDILQGLIAVESVLGKGSSFTVRIRR